MAMYHAHNFDLCVVMLMNPRRRGYGIGRWVALLTSRLSAARHMPCSPISPSAHIGSHMGVGTRAARQCHHRTPMLRCIPSMNFRVQDLEPA